MCVCVCVWGELLFLSFFLKYPMKLNKNGLTETKIFHFHRGRNEPAGGTSDHVHTNETHIIQLMHSFELNIRICKPENSDVHRGVASVNITFEG